MGTTKQKLYLIIALLCLVAAGAQAAETTVSYKFKVTFTNSGNTTQANITFERNGNKLSELTGSKTATIYDVSQCTGFTAILDDGLSLHLQMNKGRVSTTSSGDYKNLILNYSGNNNTSIDISCSNYYIKHIKLADASGNPIYATARPFTLYITGMDIDVDLAKFTNNGGNMSLFSAQVSGSAYFGMIEVTYGDTPREYSITYENAVDGENGVTNTNPTTYNVSTQDFNITEPTRTGYTFDGFYRNEEMSGTAVTLPLTIRQGDAAEMKDYTLYAKWTPITYTVVFNGNGGSGEMQNQAFTYDEERALTANAFSRTNYKFTGWNTEPDGSGTAYADGAITPNVTATNGAIVTLYAQWAINSFTVSLYKGNSASGGTNSVTATYNQPMPTISVPQRTGHIFGGYYEKADGVGTQYYNADGTSAHVWDKTSSATIYAKWTAKTFTISVNNGEGASGGPESVTATFGQSMPPITPPTREGYSFGGYYYSQDGGGTRFYNPDGSSAYIWRFDRDNITMYALWLEPVTYIDAQGIERTCTDYDVIKSDENRQYGAAGEDRWFVAKGYVNKGEYLTFKGNTHIIVMPDADIYLNNHITVNGNLDIYGQATGAGRISQNSNNSTTVTGNLTIHGGEVVLKANVTGIITIGWTNIYDEIKLTNGKPVTVKSGQYFVNDEGVLLAGDVNSSYLNNQTLRPVIPMQNDAANSATIAKYAGKKISTALMDRTIYADGAWNTICLPYGANYNNNGKIFSSYFNIMELDTENKWSMVNGKWSIDNENGTYQTGISDDILYLYFKEVEEIEAGKPYIIKDKEEQTDDVVNPVFKNAYLADLSAYNGTAAEKCQAFLEANAATSQDGKVRFRGNFDPVNLSAGDKNVLYLGADNTGSKLYWPSANMTINAFRAYFELTDGNEVKGINLNFGEGETPTGISTIQNAQCTIHNEAGAWYTLDGRKVANGQRPTAKGLYIHNGRKIVIN